MPDRPVTSSSTPWSRAAGRIVIAATAAVLTACAGPAPAPAPLPLVLADTAPRASGIDDPLRLARSVAAAYVQVTIVGEEGNTDERLGDAGPRVVSGASGIVVHEGGYVMTAAHIARSTGFRARVTTMDGAVHSARILRVERDREMALLRLDDPSGRLTPVPVGAEAQKEEAVLAIGAADGRPGSVSLGRVAAARWPQRIAYGDFGYDAPMRLEMDVVPGFSGGPLFNTRGRLLGMVIGFDLRRNAAGDMVGAGWAYAIPAAELMETASRWIASAGE